MCAALSSLEPEFQRAGGVPLVVANVFIDLVGAIENASFRHNDEVAEKLRYAADQLAAIARQATFTETY